MDIRARDPRIINQIEGFDAQVTWPSRTVIIVGDGIARADGLEKPMAATAGVPRQGRFRHGPGFT